MNIRHTIKLAIMRWSSMRHRNHKSKILFYHDICQGEGYRSLDSGDLMATDIELFKEHIAVIREEGYKIVPHIKNPEGEVAIMLDDGFRGIWENRQFFYDNKIFPTVFLPVEYIGQVDKGILSKEEILELQAHGFTFESHGWTHDELTRKTDDELRLELGESKDLLSRMLGTRVTALCLPLGLFTDHLLDEIKQYDYREVYSCVPGNYEEPAPGGMRRRNLCQFASPEEVRLILRGGNEMLKTRYQKMHHKG